MTWLAVQARVQQTDIKKLWVTLWVGLRQIVCYSPCSEPLPIDRYIQIFQNNLFRVLSTLLGSLLDRQLVNRVTACIAPRIIGGSTAPCPVGGTGIERITDMFELDKVSYETFDQDIMVSGLVRYNGR